MDTTAKKASNSWTVWFGVITLVLGATASILALLGQQNIIDLNTGIWATVYGIITIALRFKSKVAIALKIDDPSTPEDESKGEATMTDKGFARLPTMVLMALAALVMLATLSGCAHLTPKEQQAVNATLSCSTDILTSAQVCVPECLEIADKDNQKACAVACVLATLESVAPTCSKVYGDIYSPELGTAISATVVSIMQVYKAVEK